MLARSRDLTDTILHASVLHGPAAGVASVTGAFPSWLRGRLLRTAPAIFETPGWQADHWFDALGQVFSFHIDGCHDVRWRQSLLDTEMRRQAESGKVTLATFGSGNQRNWLDRLRHPVPVGTDNANVSIWPAAGDHWMAMTETHRALRVDPDTLATCGPIAFVDDLPHDMWMTAHPQLDRASGRLVNVGTLAGAKPGLVLFDYDMRTRRRRVIGRWNTPRLPYMHSFGLTARAAVLIAHPLDVHPGRFLFSNRFIEHYRWRPAQGTRLVVFDRACGSVREVQTEAMFVFHVANTFHDGEDLVMDVLAYDDAQVVTHEMRMPSMRHGLPTLTPALRRLRIRPQGVTQETLYAPGFEFPIVNHRQCAGVEHRFVWGAAASGRHGAIESKVLRFDVRSAQALTLDGGDFIFGEPIFVSRPDSTQEDDGVLLTVGHSPKLETTRLMALRAQDLHPLATADIAHRMPFGFHGAFQASVVSSRDL